MEINTKTVKFIGFLNELAKMSANGIRPFSTATTQDKDVLLYDDKHPIETEKSICIGRHNNIDDILIESLSKGKMCVPVIAPDGSIKLGESALCPPVASIYDTEDVIIDKIKHFHCRQCKIAWQKLKENIPIAYQRLTD